MPTPRTFLHFVSSMILPLYVMTLFLSASLLFAVQPMFSKMVLPLLGGSPSVWTTCVCFFQAALLAGYGYAHGLSRWPLARQAGVHLSLLLVAGGFLPFAAPDSAPHGGVAPAVWLLGVMAATVGMPFTVISATAPLLQHWFSRSRHRAATDPYFLYVASNTGSLLVLLAYPLLIERWWPLETQGWLWATGFALLLVLTATCMFTVLRMTRGGEASASPMDAPLVALLSPERRWRWLGWAFVPSSLMLGVTTHITTDLVSAPLLWVLPLVLYLLSFIVAFSARPLFRLSGLMRALPHVLILMTVFLVWAPPDLALWLLPLHLLGFFLIAVACHGKLAEDRPPASQLTGFYLLMSLGGVMGGVFNALLAPTLFSTVAEYPFVLALAWPLLKAGDGTATKREWIVDGLAALALTGLLWVGFRLMTADLPPALGLRAGLFLLILGGLSVALLKFSERPLRFGMSMLGCLLLLPILGTAPSDILMRERSFFGVYRVQLQENGDVAVMMHGTTLHGVASLRSDEQRLPMSYYAPAGPFGQVFSAASLHGGVQTVGVVGLGTGSLACYAQPGQTWDFYEIDPLVIALASQTPYFRFLSECTPNANLILGDARIELQAAADARYDILVLDAYSSDSIPAHLMTREAFALYLKKLGPGGVILFHVSNRHLALMPLVQRLAVDAGAAYRTQHFRPAATKPGESRYAALATQMVAVARTEADLAFLDGPDSAWQPAQPPPPGPLWTDRHSDLIGTLKLMTKHSRSSSGEP